MKRNILKKLTIFTLTAAMLFTTPVMADAAIVTKSTTISPLSEYTYSSGISNSGAIYVQLDEPGDYVTNIKSKNSALTAKLTRYYAYYPSSVKNYYAVIGLFANKKVSTSVSFDIYGQDNKKKESKTVKVTAANTSTKNPIKKITFGGKAINPNKLYTSKKGKMKVTMNKNYKLLKLEAGTYTAPKKSTSSDGTQYQNEQIYKTIKNNSKVTLGKYGSYYSYAYQSATGQRTSGFSSRIIAPTSIRITYQNKKTKTTETAIYYIYRLAK